jgi:hypothetical protein
VAVAFGLGAARPGLALHETAGHIAILAGVDGRVAQVDEVDVHFDLPESVALAMMDAVEEALEDSRADDVRDQGRIERLERTLALMEQCLGG